MDPDPEREKDNDPVEVKDGVTEVVREMDIDPVPDIVLL